MTALASWLQARSVGGLWFLRMEDLDRSRSRQVHADDILRCLERFGLSWDGSVVYQSTRGDAYALAAEQLAGQGLLYACTCTRRDLFESQPGIDGPVYPGTCRNAPALRPQKYALRLKVDDIPRCFTDRIQGNCIQVLSQEVGDFVIRRSDGFYAYQLAVVVDDASLGVTEVLRGADLLSSTPRQIYLQSRLGYDTPRYAHVPLLTSATGEKLSKQDQADPVAATRPQPALMACLQWLGQEPESTLADVGRDDLLNWATSHWDIRKVPRKPKLPVPPVA